MTGQNEREVGRVYLVGAGPGDPGLLTCRGREVLKTADVVVYDRLVDPSLVRLAPDGAERIYAGKGPGEQALTQPAINRILVERAGRGCTVVRLKGGDPFVFGRGGEEAHALAATGVPFEVVPGVSSAVAVPAYAGIPVTHRDVAASFLVVTGHERDGRDAAVVDWKSLAHAADTLVVLMGVAELPSIVAGLMEGGLPSSTPAALIQDGTTPRQRTLCTELHQIPEQAQEHGIRSPAILVVGAVCALRKELAWFERRPLFGRRVVITRTREQGSELAELVRLLGGEAIELPVLQIQPLSDLRDLDTVIRHLDGYSWIVFTSANAVHIFFDALRRSRADARALHASLVGVVGPATAAAVRGYGITPDVIPERATAEGLVEAMVHRTTAGQRVLFPCGRPVSDTLVHGLVGQGLSVEKVTVYEAQADPSAAERVQELRAEPVDAITFASSASVSHFLDAAGADGRAICATSRVVAIGPVTAQAAEALGLRVDAVAEHASMAALIDALVDVVGA